MIGGGTRIGDGSWIAPSACLRDRIPIGDGAMIGLATLVIKDIPDGTTILRSPGREMNDYKRLLSIFKELLKDQIEG